MTRFDIFEIRVLFGAYIQTIFDACLTARRKAASRWQVDEVRHRTGDHIQLIHHFAQDRYRCYQALGAARKAFALEIFSPRLMTVPGGTGMPCAARIVLVVTLCMPTALA